jgi:Mn-dependent DtxR family transcriptional regulator
MPTGNEKEAMTIIADEGGQCKLRVVSRGMGLPRDYTQVILESLGRAEYLDITRSGKITLKAKGYKAIGREPNFEQQWQQELQEQFGQTFQS